ncbi:MAG TPA: protein translocase subunit SecF [Patescibacteria group bacterium]|nr:protein translocase subunit SecF [Patescibacteria group bacterium]
MLNIIPKRKIWFSFSAGLMVLAVLFLSLWGLNFGIDFVGGSSMEVRFAKQAPAATEVKEALSDINLDSLIIQPTSGQEMILKFKNTDEEIHQSVLGELKNLNPEKYGSVTELQFNSVGPAIGNSLKKKSFYAVILVILAIIAYIAWAFRKVSKPIASWKYGITAVITLVHDCLVVLGVFAVLGQFYGVEITGAFIAAILTVLGYSVNDTIVIFDRIRENLPRSEEDFAGTINTSINQNITRSINTSLTTMLVLLAILILGGGSIFSFVLALLIGVFIGTYSSIFLASPMLVLWEKRS